MVQRFIFILLFIFYFDSSAQDTTFPTVDALNTLHSPSNDPIDLARRLRRVNVQFMPPSESPTWQIGDTQFFNVVNASAQQEFSINAELRGISPNVLIWIEDNVNISQQLAQQFAEIIDTTIYQQVQDLWNFAEPGGVDGDARLYILLVTGIDSGVAGYFADVHAYPRSAVPNSNQHEMMIINLSALGDIDILSPKVLTVIAHEYQHILRHFIDNNEGTWLDEGFSMLTEHHIGWDAGRSQVISFLTQPNVQLNQWVADNNRFPRYGASFLFINYFVERYGLNALHELSSEPLDNWQGVDTVLQQVGGTSADEIFADWVLANYFLDADTGYGYRTLWNDLPSARPLASVVSLPYQTESRLPSYSTDYYTVFNLQNTESLTITFSQADHTQLIPTSAFEGGYFYYSVPVDSSDVTLTRQIDLSGVTSATMKFHTWYDLEEFWDYGYVLASVDGQTWDILDGSTTRTQNPYNRAYGSGYTGRSFGWVEESIILDNYTGQEILVRFEVITDAASIRHGMAIDNLRIDEINYIDGFETASDEWDKQGWIPTDNRVPQKAWIQAVQQVGQDLTVSRWLADSTDHTWTIDLVDNVEMVLIAISPIAQQTMLESQYTLQIQE